MPQLLFSPTPLVHAKNLAGLKTAQILQNKAIRQIWQIPWHSFERNSTLHDRYNIPIISHHINSRYTSAHWKLRNKNLPDFNRLKNNAHANNKLEEYLFDPPIFEI